MRNITIVLLAIALALPTGSAMADLSKTQVSQLYIAVFGRASEGDANSYWQTDPGSTSMTATANTMLNTAPAQAYFGGTFNNNLNFIEHIYLNTLGKTYAEDEEGVDYWASELDAGKTKGEVIAALIVAAQHTQNAGSAQDRFINKVTVSDYCADTIAKYTNLGTFTGFIDGITDEAASVTSAEGLIDVERSSYSCDNSHFDICITSSDCLGEGGYWYNETCNETTDFKFTTDWLNGKVLYNVYNSDDIGKWTITPFTFAETSVSAYNSITDNAPFTLFYYTTDQGYLIIESISGVVGAIDAIKVVEETDDYLHIMWTDSVEGLNHGTVGTDEEGYEYFYFDLQKAKDFVDPKQGIY